MTAAYDSLLPTCEKRNYYLISGLSFVQERKVIDKYILQFGAVTVSKTKQNDNLQQLK